VVGVGGAGHVGLGERNPTYARRCPTGRDDAPAAPARWYPGHEPLPIRRRDGNRRWQPPCKFSPPQRSSPGELSSGMAHFSGGTSTALSRLKQGTSLSLNVSSRAAGQPCDGGAQTPHPFVTTGGTQGGSSCSSAPARPLRRK
jgi:hypothetical protein